MAHLHPVLRLIYVFLRVFAWTITTVFYRRRLVVGRTNLANFQGPAIVISNHPSTLMDVLNVGLSIPKEMFFLANYGLFKNPVSNWILTRLFCIPIKRKEDVEAGEVRDNDSAFEQSFQHLAKQGILYIAPEGYSWIYRWVRPFKTGTARIAFGAESRHDWTLGLKIYPVGLSYYAPTRFRSNVVVNYGTPIEVRTWADAWQRDSETAIDTLTAALQAQVTALTIDTRDEAGQLLIGRLEEMVAHSRPLPMETDFQRSQLMTRQFIDNESLTSQVDNYYAALTAAHVKDLGVAKATGRDSSLVSAFLLTLGFPLFVVGYLYWWLPLFLPRLLTRLLRLDIGYDSNVKALAGLFTIPLWWWASYRVYSHLWGNNTWTWLIYPTTIALAYLVAWHQRAFQNFREKQKAVFFAKSQPAAWTDLLEKRRFILAVVLPK